MKNMLNNKTKWMNGKRRDWTGKKDNKNNNRNCLMEKFAERHENA